MRPRLLALMGVLCLIGGVAATGGHAALAQAPPAPTVGIRIVDAPSNRADDPRAKLYIVDHVAPGTTLSRRVEVSNDTGDPQPVQLYAASGSVADGAFQFGDGRSANDLTRWTTVDPTSVSLAPGAKALATVTIVVPPNATAGEQYGVIWAELNAPPPPGGGIGAVNRVGVRMYLSVGPGGEPPTDFQITTLEAQRAADGSPVVAATVHNTGGRAVDLSGDLRLSNGPGGLSAGPFEAKLGTTLGIDQTEPVLVMLDRAVPAGPWDARIVLRSGTTEREATAKITFPAAAASSSGPVKTHVAGSSSPALPIAIGAAVLLGLLLFLFLFLRKRRRAEEEQPAHT